MGMEILRGMTQYFNCVFFGPKVKILISFLFNFYQNLEGHGPQISGSSFLGHLEYMIH